MDNLLNLDKRYIDQNNQIVLVILKPSTIHHLSLLEVWYNPAAAPYYTLVLLI